MSLFTAQQKRQYLSAWYGGEKSLGFRKRKRPFKRGSAMHLVLRSSRAKGEWGLLRSNNRAKIAQVLAKQSRRHQVEVVSIANVGNHLHLVVKAATRDGFKKFLKSFAALTARGVTGARRGHAIGGRFWDHTVFTRVLGSLREFRGGIKYVWLNQIEGEFGKKAREFAKCSSVHIEKSLKAIHKVNEFL